MRRDVLRGGRFLTSDAQSAGLISSILTPTSRSFSITATRCDGQAVFYFQVATRDCRRGNEGSGFDSIGDDRVLGAAQCFDSFNLDPDWCRRRARALPSC